MTIAVAAQTNRPSAPVPPGSERWFTGTITLDNSYPTNGYAVTAATFGFNRLDAVIVSGSTLVGRLATYVNSTGKIKLYVSSTAVEVGSGIDVSADKVDVIAIGV